MPYKSLKDANPALRGIEPKITLAQANLIAKWADAMEKAEDGPESAWAAAIAQFKKLYKSEGGKWVKRKQKESSDYKGYTTSTNNVLIAINAIDIDGEAVPVAELVAAYEERQDDNGDLQEEISGTDVTKARELLEQALAALGGRQEIAEVELSESAAGHAVGLAEIDDNDISAGPRAPLTMEVALIQPGFGNKKDNHYYPREVLERDIHVFEGVKMYATDHRPDEKSVRTEVAVVKACPYRFLNDGTPIALAAVHDGDFAEQARNRAKLGTLESLECSILGGGRVKKGEMDGQKTNIVEAITKGQSVDWVTNAGAGGHALNLAENDGGNIMSEQEKEKQEKVEETSEAQTEEVTLAEKQDQAQEKEEPQKLAEAKITEMLSEANLPSTAKKRLAKGEYEDKSALREAILAEAEYVKVLTGSGRPFAQGGQAQQKEIKPLEERLAEIDRRYGIQVQGQEG